MKNKLRTIKTTLAPLTNVLERYKVLIFLVSIFTIYAMLILRINLLNNKEPDSADISSQLQTVPRPKIDESTVEKIQQLQDNSVEIKTLFNSTRKNPFLE